VSENELPELGTRTQEQLSKRIKSISGTNVMLIRLEIGRISEVASGIDSRL
jgi:hypothetical protein